MNIIIDNIDFWNLDAMKYWSFPSSYDSTAARLKQKQWLLLVNILVVVKWMGPGI